MGAISTFFDFTKLMGSAAKASKINPDDVKAAAAMFGKAKSISAQASKYVMEYPVACTDSITDINVALGIAKQIEYDCARFILLSSGLHPEVNSGKGDTIELHLNSLMSSYENYSGFKCMITKATPEEIRSAENYMENVFSEEEYHSTNKSAFSVEMIEPESLDQVIEAQKDTLTDNIDDDNTEGLPTKDQILNWVEECNASEHTVDLAADNIGRAFYKKFGGDQITDPAQKEAFDEMTNTLVENAKKFKIKDFPQNSVSVDDRMLGALGKHQPTVINVKFILQDGNGGMRPYDVPLAIRSNIHWLSSHDIKDLLTKVTSPNKKFQTFIKLTTGEISFFKDWMLNLKDAESDVERERTLGQTPMYRSLLGAKNKHRLKSIFGHVPIIKNFIAKKTQQDLPMCTVIITEAELAEVTRMKLNNLLRDRTFINNVIDTFMLLCFGIIDTQTDVAYFFYSGEKDPQIIPLSKLSDKSTNTTDSLAKVVERMSSMISRR